MAPERSLGPCRPVVIYVLCILICGLPFRAAGQPPDRGRPPPGPDPVNPAKALQNAQHAQAQTLGTSRDANADPSQQTLALQFIQDRLNTLAYDQRCLAMPGVAGIKQDLERNLSAVAHDNASISDSIFVVRSKGNRFAINMQNESFEINSMSDSNFFIITTVHLFVSALAFFLVYPIILMSLSLARICTLVGFSMDKNKVDSFVTRMYAFALLPMVTVGFAFGILGMGESDHFRTEHGIVGLVLTILMLISIPVFFAHRWFAEILPPMDLRAMWFRVLSLADSLLCQAILLMSTFVLSDGLDDFSAMSLCSTNVVQLSLAVSLGETVVFIWNTSAAVMMLDWWLGRRIATGTKLLEAQAESSTEIRQVMASQRKSAIRKGAYLED